MSRLRGAAFPFYAVSLLLCGASNALAQTTPQPPASAPTSTTPSPAPAGSPSTTAPVETVVVTARPNDQNTKIDRTTYDIRTNPQAPVTPAVDVIAKLPGVFVGPNNRISIAGGAYVTILVDGRPMLRDAALQIPAERIASIEVISNPSAEFASSSEAIINIVLKKTAATDKISGSLGASLDTSGNQGLSLSVDRRKGDWGGTLSLRLGQRGSVYHSLSDRRFQNAGGSGIDQVINEDTSESKSKQANGYARITYDINEFQDLEFTSSFFYLTGEGNGLSLETIRSGNDQQVTPLLGVGPFQVDYAGTALTYKSEKEKDYKFEVTFGYSQNGFKSDYLVQTRNLTREQDQATTNATSSFDAKFEKHFSGDRLFATGGSFSTTDYTLTYNNFGFLSPTARQNDRFEARQNDMALYATYQFKIGKVGVLPGMRFEQSEVDWVSRLAASRGDNLYQRFLPSLFLTYKLGANGKLRASYSDGTTSLSFDELNPSLRYQGRASAVQGNPLLEPADRRTVELGYDFDNNKVSLISTLFYRDTRNQIVNFSRRGVGDLLITNSVNLGETLAYGLGSTLKGKIGTKLSYTLDFEVSSNRFSNPFFNGLNTNEDRLGYNGKFIFDYKPNSDDQFSVTTTFQSDVYGLGTETAGFWTSNFQFSHKFPGRVSLVINAIDVGVSPLRQATSRGAGFESLTRWSEPSRALKVGLTKRF